MPQGKVIAVQPLGFIGSALQDDGTFSTTRSYTRDSVGGHKEGSNEVYIAVCRGNIDNCNVREVKKVVWYEDSRGKLEVGDYVDFKIDPGRSKSFEAARDVVKLRGKVMHLPGGLLSKVALLASLLLLVAVMNDTRR